MAIEIMSFPSKDADLGHSYVAVYQKHLAISQPLTNIVFSINIIPIGTYGFSSTILLLIIHTHTVDFPIHIVPFAFPIRYGYQNYNC